MVQQGGRKGVFVRSDVLTNGHISGR